MRRVVARIALRAGARAAVPPLDPDTRERRISLSGRIVSATAEEVSRREGHVDSVSIGQLEWKCAQGTPPRPSRPSTGGTSARPAGWTGHQGQAPAPPRTCGSRFCRRARRTAVPVGSRACRGSGAEAAADADAAGATARPRSRARRRERRRGRRRGDRRRGRGGRRENPIRALIRSFFKVLAALCLDPKTAARSGPARASGVVEDKQGCEGCFSHCAHLGGGGGLGVRSSLVSLIARLCGRCVLRPPCAPRNCSSFRSSLNYLANNKNK